MFVDWHDVLELADKVADLGLKFLVGDAVDIIKILLSIVATVYFGRRYVKRHLRKLIDRQIDDIAAQEAPDREAIKVFTYDAIRKAQGRRSVTRVFDVRNGFETAARYFAQRQPHYAVELLERETLLAQAAASLCEKRAQNARVKAATAQLQIGLMARSRGESVNALRAFKTMLELNPHDVDGLRFAGQELEGQRRLSEARELYESMERFAIGSGENLLLAEALRSLARVEPSFRDALVLLDQCLVLEKSTHHDLGMAYTWKTIGDLRTGVGHWNLAEDAYDSAINIFRALGHHEAHQETVTAREAMMQTRIASRPAAVA